MATVHRFPKKATGLPKIYLGGKACVDGWRSQVVPELENVFWGEGSAMSWPQMPMHVGGFDGLYTGPYFMNCGHGCYFGEHQNGVGATQEEHENCGSFTHIDPLADASRRRRFVVDETLSAIRSSDVVYFWIEDPSSPGPLVEIGYARGAGKPVVIASPVPIADIWFAHEVADLVLTIHCPVLGLESVMRIVAEHGVDVRQWNEGVAA